MGELFALPGSAISEAFQSIFVEFLKRLTDREVEVRMSALDYVKRCLLSNPLRPEAAQIFGNISPYGFMYCLLLKVCDLYSKFFCSCLVRSALGL